MPPPSCNNIEGFFVGKVEKHGLQITHASVEIELITSVIQGEPNNMVGD
jgi:hypothetical protein